VNTGHATASLVVFTMTPAETGAITDAKMYQLRLDNMDGSRTMECQPDAVKRFPVL
jgi:hypothetical protein